MILALAAVAAFGRLSLGSVQGELDRLIADRIVKVEHLEALKDEVNVIAQGVHNIALLPGSEAKQAEMSAIEKAKAAKAERVRALGATLTAERGRALLASAAETRESYKQSAGQVIAFGRAHMAEAATDLIVGELRNRQSAYMARPQAPIEFQRELMAASGARVHATVATAGWLVLAIALGAGAAGALLAWAVRRSITGPIRQAVALVKRVVATMADISASSRRIADIIGVIDGIAFQTHILALNAAVVAGEVRSLARRSAEAAKEIKSLIGEIAAPPAPSRPAASHRSARRWRSSTRRHSRTRRSSRRARPPPRA